MNIYVQYKICSRDGRRPEGEEREVSELHAVFNLMNSSVRKSAHQTLPGKIIISLQESGV